MDFHFFIQIYVLREQPVTATSWQQEAAPGAFSRPCLSFTPELSGRLLQGVGCLQCLTAALIVHSSLTDPGRWDRYYGSRFRDPRTWDRRYWYDSEHDPYRKESYAYSDRLVNCTCVKEVGGYPCLPCSCLWK